MAIERLSLVSSALIHAGIPPGMARGYFRDQDEEAGDLYLFVDVPPFAGSVVVVASNQELAEHMVKSLDKVASRWQPHCSQEEFLVSSDPEIVFWRTTYLPRLMGGSHDIRKPAMAAKV